MQQNVRTRFAPSPTGSLHIASIRNALYCYALAKKYKGNFVVRIEDTDQSRYVANSIEEIFKVLKYFGLEPDESMFHGGKHGPYIQSSRLHIYKKYIQKLIESGNAYYCFLNKKEIETLKPKYKGRGFRSPWRNAPQTEIQKMLSQNIPYTIRLKVPENQKIEFHDAIQGQIIFDTNIVGDEILIKSNQFPSYHFAVVVDDYEMEISHVIRSIEWLPSTPKQILIHKFLNLPMPIYAHPPVILDPDGGKLSKRKGTVAAIEFLKQGYLPEAILNFVMLLGWSPPIKRTYGEKEQEIYSLSEFVELFDLKDINKSNPTFNRNKLIWFNQQYIKNINPDKLTEYFLQWIKEFKNNDNDNVLINKIINDNCLIEKVKLLNTRSKTLEELFDGIKFFYISPSTIRLHEIQQIAHFFNQIEIIFENIYSLIKNMPEDTKIWDHQSWFVEMEKISKKYGINKGDPFMLLRILITGNTVSPPLFESIQIIGKSEVIHRLEKFYEYIKK